MFIIINITTKKTNAIAVLKILSYFTFVIPLFFAAVYGAASLCGRVSKKQHLSPQDKGVHDQAMKTIVKNNQPDQPTDQPASNPVHFFPFLAKAYAFAGKQPHEKPDVLLSYIINVLNDPQFQNNPKEYLKNWKQKRGNTEEFRIPEDQAMIFFEREVLSNINTKELSEKAAIFVKDREYSNEISSYIENVIANPSFQENPQLFMAQWKEKRGCTEEFRIVEDSARIFFDKELQPHRL